MNLTKRFDDSVHASVQEMITDDVKNVVRIKKWHTRRQPTVSLMLLPHFDVFCDLLLNRRRATGNLSFFYFIKRGNKIIIVIIIIIIMMIIIVIMIIIINIIMIRIRIRIMIMIMITVIITIFI